MKTTTVVDAATVSTALSALRLGASTDITDWEALCLAGATRALLNEGVTVTLPPGVSGSSPRLGGVYSAVVESLQVKPETTPVPPDQMQRTREWMLENRAIVLSRLDSLLSDTSFPGWIDRNMRWVGETHSSLYAGLFEKDLISVYAQLLDVSDSELLWCHQKSQDPSYHPYVSAATDDGSRLVQKAYMLSALVRGMWHLEHSRTRGTTLVAHPFRWKLSEDVSSVNGTTQVLATRAEQILLQILVGSSLREDSEEARIHAWLRNIGNLRSLRAAGKIAFPETDDERVANEYASMLANQAQMGITGTRFQRGFDFAANVLFGVGLGFVVSPWYIPVAAGISLAALSLSSKSSLLQCLLTTSHTVRDLQYRELARLAPGTVRNHLGRLGTLGRGDSGTRR